MRKQVRQRILEKYNYKCNYCGSIEKLEVDHIIPLSKGGKHNESNMQILCRTCNRTKKDKIDFSKYFKRGDGNYIYVSGELLNIKITGKELHSLIDYYLEEYCYEAGLD